MKKILIVDDDLAIGAAATMVYSTLAGLFFFKRKDLK